MSDDAKTNEEVEVKEDAKPEEAKEEAKVEDKKEEAKEEKKEEPKKEEPKEEKKEEPKEEKKEPTIELKGDAKKIMDLVKGLSAIELNQLVKALEEEFGVSAAAPVMMGGGGGGGGDDGGGGSDSMTVELAEVGQSKIAVIKAVKDILGLGLKEAKDLVGEAPVVIKENIPADEAEKIKATLEENGATVAFK